MSTAAATPKRSDTINITDFYVPWQKQRWFHECDAKYRLQVGSFGSGKSLPLLMEAIAHAIEVPGSNSIILRKTVPDLKRTVIDKFLSDVPKALYEHGSQEKGTYNQSDHIVFFPPVPQWNADGSPKMGPGGKQETLQSKIFFAACERIEDVSKFLSTEFVFIGFEELGEFPYPIWDAFEGRCRCPIPGSRPCMAAATNPMGVGWGWIRRLWIEKKPVKGMNPDKYNPLQYRYIHSTVDDNPIYSQNQEYVDSLEKSPNAARIRWGRLDVVSGQYFANWEPTRHERAAKDFIFEPWHPVWVGWDYGFGHYAVILFFTKATLRPRHEKELPKLVNVTIGEIILHEQTPEEQAQALIAHLPRIGQIVGMKRVQNKNPFYREPEEAQTDHMLPAPIESIHLSWERFINSTKNSRGEKRSVADEIGDILASNGVVRPVRGNTDRVAGWTKMYSMLEYDEWFILAQECPTLCSSLPLAVRGDGITVSMEDVVKPKGLSLEDDCNDACRYGVAGVLLDEGEKPREIIIRDKLAGIEDPMRRHVEAYKEYNKYQAEQRRGLKQVIVPSWVNRVRGGNE
jgi:phage terminase large subunit